MGSFSGIILGIVGCIMGYLVLEYFFFLCRPKKANIELKHRLIMIAGALIVGFTFAGGMNRLQDALIMMLVCAELTAITGVFNRKSGDIFQWIVFFSAALLNISSAYGIVYAVCRVLELTTLNGPEESFHIITMCITFLGAAGIVAFLRFSGIFPNDSLKTILNDARKRIPLSILLSLFCIGNVSTIYLLTPSLEYVEMAALQAKRIYIDLFIKDFVILIGAYLSTLFLCNLDKSESKSENLHNELNREKAFRINLSHGEMTTFCIDLDNDVFLEGEDFFEGIFDGMFEKNEVPYSKAMQILMKSLCHPYDLKKLEPYLRKETLMSYMKDTPVRNEEIRVSRHVFELYLAPDGSVGNTEIQLLGRTEKDIHDSEWLWLSLRYSMTDDATTGKHCLYILVSNIDERKKKELLLRESAERDALTGLYNRAYFEDRVSKLLEDGIECGCFYMVDADHLKQVNDKLGHAEGDRMLQNVAEILRKVFRNGDVTARLGGDEFVIFAPGLRDIGEIRRRAEKINEYGRREYSKEDGTIVKTSLSIGISLYPLHGKALKELLGHADAALYDVKKASRDSYKIFE